MMVNGFKMLICFGLSLGMIIYYKVPIGWQALYAIPSLITILIFTFGCCCILLHLGVFIDDMANVINIVLRFVFYLTGIFYNINIVLFIFFTKKRIFRSQDSKGFCWWCRNWY